MAVRTLYLRLVGLPDDAHVGVFTPAGELLREVPHISGEFASPGLEVADDEVMKAWLDSGEPVTVSVISRALNEQEAPQQSYEASQSTE